jgi:predicted hydrocarbon binding protein
MVKKVDEDNSGGNEQEWQGMIKELKKQSENTRLKVGKEIGKALNEANHNFMLMLNAHRAEVNEEILEIKKMSSDTNEKIDMILEMLSKK